MKLGVVEIIVKDFDECLKFYRDSLGLKIIYEEKKHKFVMFDTGTTKLALFGAKRFSRDKFSHVKFYFPTKDIERALHNMKKKGVVFTSGIQKRHWGKVATFIDPENNEHYLYEERG